MKLNFTITKFPSGSFLIHDGKNSDLPFKNQTLLMVYADGSKLSELPRMVEGIPEALNGDQYHDKFLSKIFSK
jgi:hypothetical protein